MDEKLKAKSILQTIIFELLIRHRDGCNPFKDTPKFYQNLSNLIRFYFEL